MEAKGPLASLESALDELGRGRVVLGCLLLVALVHLPLLSYPLVYDDGWILITNGFLREPDLGLLFSPKAVTSHVPDAFRPTSVLFDVLSYRLFGLNAVAHHLTSILLHVGVCALLWRWLAQLGASGLLSTATCLLFGVTALHGEVIAVVSYREDLLAALIGLVGLILASHALRQTSGLRVLLACVGALCALLLACGAKLSAAGLPFAWLVLELLHPFSEAPASRSSRRAMVFLALLCGVALALLHRYFMFGGLNPYGATGDVSLSLWSQRVGTQALWAASLQIQTAYLAQSLLPFGLSPEYSDRGALWLDLGTVLAAAVWAGLVLAALSVARADIRRRAPRRLLAACIVAGIVLLLPTANLVPMPNMRADRFTYLPSLASSLGWAALALAVGAQLHDKMKGPKSAPGLWVLAPLIALCTVQASFERAATSAFFSNTTLWETASRRAPTSARARAMQGLMRLAAGAGRASSDAELRALVLQDCRRAELLDPLEARSQICFARLAVELGEHEEAHQRFSRAIALEPAHAVTWIGARAELALELGVDQPGSPDRRSRTPREAEEAQRGALNEVQGAIAVFPYAEELQLVAGRLAHRQGRPELAAQYYARARSLRPERWESVAAMLELQLDLGHIPRARQLWQQEAKLLRHAHPPMRDHLAALLEDGSKLGILPKPN